MEVDNQVPEGRLVPADEQQLAIGLSGAVIATMALFDRAGRSTLRLCASAGATGHASFVVAQSAVAVPDLWASRAFDQRWTDRPGGPSAVASMLALKRIADISSGSVTAASTRRGTSITLTMPMA